MELFIGIAVAVGFVLFIGLKSYAESCLPWKHPLNLLLNGHPTQKRPRQSGLIDGTGDSGVGDSCGD